MVHMVLVKQERAINTRPTFAINVSQKGESSWGWIPLTLVEAGPVQNSWVATLAHAVHLQVSAAAVAHTGSQLPESCVTDITHPCSEKGAYILLPHLQSHEPHNLNIVIA